MNRDIINTAILAASFLSLFAVAELIYYKLGVRAELTRKLVHIGTGLLTLLFPVMLGNHWLVLFLCASFAVIILASLRFKFLRSINGIDRKSHGSISYPISVYGCYLVYNYFLTRGSTGVNPFIYFYIPILTLAICDPVAALVGKRFQYGRYSIGRASKTLAGSLAFIASSFVLSVGLFAWLSFGQHGLVSMLGVSLTIAILACIAEALSGNGLDNITIPATVVLILILWA